MRLSGVLCPEENELCASEIAGRRLSGLQLGRGVVALTLCVGKLLVRPQRHSLLVRVVLSSHHLLLLLRGARRLARRTPFLNLRTSQGWLLRRNTGLRLEQAHMGHSMRHTRRSTQT